MPMDERSTKNNKDAFGRMFVEQSRDYTIRMMRSLLNGTKRNTRESEENLYERVEDFVTFRKVLVESVDETSIHILRFLIAHRDKYKIVDEDGNEVFGPNADLVKDFYEPGGWVDKYASHPRSEKY